MDRHYAASRRASLLGSTIGGGHEPPRVARVAQRPAAMLGLGSRHVEAGAVAQGSEQARATEHFHLRRIIDAVIGQHGLDLAGFTK